MSRLLGIVILVALAVLAWWRPWQTVDVSPDDIAPPAQLAPTDAADPPKEKPMNPFMTGADRIASIGGTTIRLREEGPADAPVLVLLHGYTFSLESFDGWAAALSDQYRVIRFDLLGHGLTGPDPARRYAPLERAAFLGEVLDTLGVERAHVAGNSLGGLVAWRFAAMNPDRVERLVLVSPAAFPINGVTDEPAPIPPGLAFFLKTAPLAGVKASLELSYADDSKITQERLALAHAMMTQPGNGEAFVHHLEEFTLPDPVDALGQVGAPTLILWGTDDALIPVDQAGQMAAAMPNATVTLIPDTGHVAHEEETARTAEAVRAFLAASSN